MINYFCFSQKFINNIFFISNFNVPSPNFKMLLFSLGFDVLFLYQKFVLNGNEREVFPWKQQFRAHWEKPHISHRRFNRDEASLECIGRSFLYCFAAIFSGGRWKNWTNARLTVCAESKKKNHKCLLLLQDLITT